MRSSICAAFFVLAFTATAFCQRPGVKGPAEVAVPVGRLARVPIELEGDEFRYAFLGEDSDAFREFDPDPRRVVLRVVGYTPRIVYVVAYARKGEALSDPLIVKVTIGNPEPVPVPPPVPPPGPTPPPPTPAKDAAWLIVLSDQANDDPKIAAVISDVGFRKAIEGYGLKFRAYDSKGDSAKRLGYLEHAKTFPAYLLISKSGAVVGVGTLPDNASTATDTIRKAVGK